MSATVLDKSVDVSATNNETDKEFSTPVDVQSKGSTASEHEAPLIGAKSPGVARIEALNAHTSLINRYCIFFGLFLVAYAYGLDGTLRYTYQPNATADFKTHSTLATINVLRSVIAAAAQPTAAKIGMSTNFPTLFNNLLITYDSRRIRPCRNRLHLHHLLHRRHHRRSHLHQRPRVRRRRRALPSRLHSHHRAD